jgi:hypothetical protein
LPAGKEGGYQLGMQSLEEIFSQSRGRLSLSRLLRLYRIRKHWHEFATGPLSAHSFPKELRDDGTLVVVTPATVWIVEGQFHAEPLLHAINRRLRAHHLKGIEQLQWKVGELPKSASPARAAQTE